MSDEAPIPAAEAPSNTLREQYFKRNSHDLSGLPSALKADMKRLVNRGPTPEMVARVKHQWASKKGTW